MKLSPSERIRSLSNELSKALDEWNAELEGETWAIRIYPSTIKGHGVYLENISYCADVVLARETPTHCKLVAGGAR